MIIRVKRVGSDSLWFIVKTNNLQESITIKDEWDQYMPTRIPPGKKGVFKFRRKIVY